MRVVAIIVATMGALLASDQETPKVRTVGAVPTSPASGKEMFRAYCGSCHGVNGKGDGPAASALKSRPVDLTLLTKTNGGKFPAMRVMNSIKDGQPAGHGSKEMPVWGPILSSVSDNPGVVDQRVANLVGYVESIQVK